MSNTLTTRPAEAGDVPAIRAIVAATELFPPEMLDDMIASHLGGDATEFWIVADDGQGPLGFAYCAPEVMTEGTWNLLAIGVMPDRHGTGAGRALVTCIETMLVARSARVLLIETMGTPEFDRTRRFYQQCGYVEEARIRDYYEAGGDKIVFWKALVLNSAD